MDRLVDTPTRDLSDGIIDMHRGLIYGLRDRALFRVFQHFSTNQGGAIFA